MTWRQWRMLFADSFRVHSRAVRTRDRDELRLQLKLKRVLRGRRRARRLRLEGYAIGWDQAQAIRDDRVRTIRLELERRHLARLDRKVVRFTHGGQVG